MGKFEIHPIDQKFKIQAQTITKNIEFQGKAISWVQQKDSNSCGYCLIHNASNFLIPNYEGNTEKIFSDIDENSDIKLERKAYLKQFDMSRYFQRKNFQCIPFAASPQDKTERENILKNFDFKLIVLSSNGHYTGIITNNGHLIYLNSLNDSPISINMNQALSILKKDNSKASFIVKNPIKKKFEVRQS